MKPKIWRRKDLLLAANKKNTGELSQSSCLPNKTGEVSAKGACIFMKGLGQ